MTDQNREHAVYERLALLVALCFVVFSVAVGALHLPERAVYGGVLAMIVWGGWRVYRILANRNTDARA